MCISEMKDWSKVAMDTDPCVGVTRRALSDILEKIKVEVNRLSKSGQCWWKFLIHLLNIRKVKMFWVFLFLAELKRLEKYTGNILYFS